MPMALPVFNSAQKFGIPVGDLDMGLFGDDPLVNWLSQFCILSKEKQEQYSRVFDLFASTAGSLTTAEVRTPSPSPL
jgi:hypothetical protein